MRKKIEDVFTPRNQSVNSSMYIEREDHEKNLIRSVNGSMHSFLFGESGSGKSWLYKKVFKEKKVNYVVINSANASRNGSITNELFSKCSTPGSAEKTSFKEGKKAGVSAIGKAEISHESEYKVNAPDRLLECYKMLYKASGKTRTIVVIDNVETIVKNQNLMNELCDILILLDDEEYAQYEVKFLLIAVPNDVLQYFSSAKNPASIANRLDELPKITGLSSDQVLVFVHRGLVEALEVKINLPKLKSLARHIYTVTLGIPQRVHEYCECLSYCLEDNGWKYSDELVSEADGRWLKRGLRECYNVIQLHLGSDQRRSQVIYSLGRISTHQIDTKGIGIVIEEDFPKSAPKRNSGIGQVLARLAKGDNPILKPISNSSFYTFCDPRYLMCIRLILYKEEGTEEVKKRAFKLN